MWNPLVSVIIPAYNTEKYIRSCIDSVRVQTYKNLEIIIVNDCSEDNCDEIIFEYKKIDSRIKYVKNEKNLGLFAARLEGYKRSSGEYIAFLDSDDRVGVDYYRLMVKMAVQKSADIVASRLVVERDNTQKVRTMGDYAFTDINLYGQDILRGFLETECYSSHWWIGCCKLISRNLFERCFADLSKLTVPLTMHEDLIFSVIFMSKANRFVTVDCDSYFYVRHKNSVSFQTNDFCKLKSGVFDANYAICFVEEYLIKLGLDKKYVDKFSNIRKIISKTLSDRIADSRFDDMQKNELIAQVNMISNESTDSSFFYEQHTNWDNRYENIKKRIMNPQFSYISFDIFDTLIVRPFYKPSDIFILMDSYFDELTGNKIEQYFSKIRIKSEQAVDLFDADSSKHIGQVTIDQIYHIISQKYGIDLEVVEALKHREKQLEIQFSSPRQKIKELYELALYIGKKVICISDMYLDIDTINKILCKNGYIDFEHIFLSSECGVDKVSGSLFKHALSVLGVEADQMFHIGDNWEYDCIQPKKLGITAWFVAKPIELLMNVIPDMNGKKQRSELGTALSCGINQGFVKAASVTAHFGIRCMLAMVANKMFDNPYLSYEPNTDFNRNPYYIGYFAVGMHTFGIANWIMKEAMINGNKTIHFVARDGFLIKQIYDILARYQHNAPTSNYFYTSRKAFLPFTDAVDEVVSFKGKTPRDVLNLFSPVTYKTSSFIEQKYSSQGIDLDSQITNQDEFEVVLDAIRKNSVSVEKQKRYETAVVTYINQTISKGDAMFDIGYSGRTQGTISKLCSTYVDAFYLHTIDDKLIKNINKYGFSCQCYFDYTPNIIGRMREFVLSEFAPSCTHYVVTKKGMVYPGFEQKNQTYPQKIVINRLQKGAIDFTTDLLECFGEYMDMLAYRHSDISFAHEYFLHNPKHADMEMFRAFTFEDDLLQGNAYGEKSLTDLWLNDLKKTNHKKPQIKQEVVSLSVKSPPKTLYDNFNINGMSRLQRLGYYCLFDRRMLKQRLSDRYENKPIRLRTLFFIYNCARTVKNRYIGNVLYVATSLYNVLCCVLHKLKYNRNKKAVLMIASWRKNVYQQLVDSKLFSDVYIENTAVVRDFVVRIDDKLSAQERADIYLDFYERNLPVNVHQFYRIYLCNDTMPIGQLLCERQIKYYSIEEASGVFNDKSLLKSNIDRFSPQVEKYLLDKHQILGKNRCVKKYYILKKFIHYNTQKTVRFEPVMLLKNLSSDNRKTVLNIFNATEAEAVSHQKTCLLLTYPMAQRLGITFSEQYYIYAQLLDIFAGECKVHIKPHPDDNGVYDGRYKNSHIIDKAIPSELLWYVAKTKYCKAVSVISSSLNSLTEFEIGIAINQEFSTHYNDLLRYYMCAHLIKFITNDYESIHFVNIYNDLLFAMLNHADIAVNRTQNQFCGTIFVVDGLNDIPYKTSQNDIIILLNATLKHARKYSKQMHCYVMSGINQSDGSSFSENIFVCGKIDRKLALTKHLKNSNIDIRMQIWKG